MKCGNKGPTKHLSPEHRREIEDGSGVSRAIRVSRGYYSVTSRAELEDTLLKDYQRRAPAWVAPMYSPDGHTTSLQIKPERPRKDKRGKPIKYDSPAGGANILDVHPFNFERLRDLTVRLWITEGCKKADSLASRGECVIALAGVWNWLRKCEPLPCWEHVPLEGRETYIVFDSDVMVKPEVQDALQRLVVFLEGRGARVQVVYLPEVRHEEDAAKTGLDDYLVAGGTVQELLLMARPFEARDFGEIRLSRNEKLRAGVEDLWKTWRSMGTVTQRECSARAVDRVLIEKTAQSGKVKAGEGLLVKMALRSIAERARLGLTTVKEAIDYAEDTGLLRRDNEGRKGAESSEFVLFTRDALPEQNGGRGAGGGEGQEREEKSSSQFSPLFSGPSDHRVRVAQPPAEVQELRWPTVLVSRELDKEGQWQKVYEYLARLGKKRGEIIRFLLEAGGSATVEDLMESFAGERTRPYDFKRRQLAELAGWRYDRKIRKWLATGPPLIAVEGDTVTLLDGWSEALEKHRELGREDEAARLQAESYALQSKAFRNYLEDLRRGKKPDRAPSRAEMDERRRERESSGADGAVAELEKLPDEPLVSALAEYLERNPRDATQLPGWLATTLWAHELVGGKPDRLDVERALELLGGERYKRMLLERVGTAPRKKGWAA